MARLIYALLLRLSLTAAYLFGVMAMFAAFGPFGVFNDRQWVIFAASVVPIVALIAWASRREELHRDVVLGEARRGQAPGVVHDAELSR